MEIRLETITSNSLLALLFELVLEYVGASDREDEPQIEASPREVLEELMRSRGMSQKDLECAGMAKQACNLLIQR